MVTDSEKHCSLLQYRLNYSHKKYYSTCLECLGMSSYVNRSIEQHTYKNVNNYCNTKIIFYSETSSAQNFNI